MTPHDELRRAALCLYRASQQSHLTASGLVLRAADHLDAAGHPVLAQQCRDDEWLRLVDEHLEAADALLKGAAL